jgi:hypothetical protein
VKQCISVQPGIRARLVPHVLKMGARPHRKDGKSLSSGRIVDTGLTIGPMTDKGRLPDGNDQRAICISPRNTYGKPMSNEQSRNSESQKVLSRPSAKEIYVQVAGSARDELKRSKQTLPFVGIPVRV